LAGSLKRILRLRHLAEEQARLELERETQRLRQAQSARILASNQVRSQREQLADSFVNDAQHSAVMHKEDADKEKDWLLAEAALEFSAWSQMQLEQWCIQEAERVAPLAEQYQHRRRELRQVEQLLENQADAERIVQDRREQTEADSWFQIETMRQARAQRNAEKPSPPPPPSKRNAV
jgi:hypothetical protein